MLGGRRLIVVTTVAALAFAGVVGFDLHQRAEGGRTLRGEAAALHEAIMRLQDRVPAGRADDDVRFAATVFRLERAMADGERSVAIRAWREAYGLALQSSRWEPMLELGDAALTLGAMSGSRAVAESQAREAYLIALVRARRAESAAGVLGLAEAAGALGDAAMAREVRRLSDVMTVAATPAL